MMKTSNTHAAVTRGISLQSVVYLALGLLSALLLLFSGWVLIDAHNAYRGTERLYALIKMNRHLLEAGHDLTLERENGWADIAKGWNEGVSSPCIAMIK